MGPTFEQFMMCYVFWVPWDRVLDRARSYAARVHGEHMLGREAFSGANAANLAAPPPGESAMAR
jgi:hypothetical protein